MKKQFLVALHVQNEAQVFAEIQKILLPDGAHGVLLVNNGLHVLSSKEENYPNLFDLTVKVKERFPNYLVGVNPLDLKTRDALEAACTIQADYMEIRETKEKQFDILWTDNGGIQESEGNAFLSKNLSHHLGSLGLPSFGINYYGGIAFKYLPQPKNLSLVAKVAAEHFSVVVTSGEKTGKPPDVEKIKLIKDHIGEKPLAIASGLTAENVAMYAKYADVFIVGTSLLIDQNNEFVYDQEKVRNFRKALESI